MSLPSAWPIILIFRAQRYWQHSFGVAKFRLG